MGTGRSTKEQVELLRRRIWMHRARGLTIAQIAQAVGKSTSAISYHLKKIRQNVFDYYHGAGETEILGEMLLSHRELRQEAFRNLARTQPGTPIRLQFAQEARQAIRAEATFMFDVGLLRKAPDKLDVTVADVRQMSVDEIRAMKVRLQRELALTPIQGIDDESDDPELDVIDITPSTVEQRTLGAERGNDYGDDDDDDDDLPEEFEEFDPFDETIRPMLPGPMDKSA